MTQHSQGEWKDEPNPMVGGNRMIVCGEVTIAYIPYEHNELGRLYIGNSEANGRLIAAAPKLLEALIEAEENLHHPGSARNREIDLAELFRAAIVAAKGEQ